MQRRVEQERQAFIDSAKFVERMNKERRERDMRILKQRERLLKKMDEMHEKIVKEAEERRQREEEQKLENRQRVIQARIDEKRERMKYFGEDNATSNKVVHELIKDRREREVRVRTQGQSVGIGSSEGGSRARNASQALELPVWDKYSRNPYGYSNNLEKVMQRKEAEVKKRRIEDPREKMKRLELANRRLEYGKYVNRYYIPKGVIREAGAESPKADAEDKLNIDEDDITIDHNEKSATKVKHSTIEKTKETPKEREPHKPKQKEKPSGAGSSPQKPTDDSDKKPVQSSPKATSKKQSTVKHPADKTSEKPAATKPAAAVAQHNEVTDSKQERLKSRLDKKPTAEGGKRTVQLRVKKEKPKVSNNPQGAGGDELGEGGAADGQNVENHHEEVAREQHPEHRAPAEEVLADAEGDREKILKPWQAVDQQEDEF